MEEPSFEKCMNDPLLVDKDKKEMNLDSQSLES